MDHRPIFARAEWLERALRRSRCTADADRLRRVLEGDPPSLRDLHRALVAVIANAETQADDEPEAQDLLADVTAALHEEVRQREHAAPARAWTDAGIVLALGVIGCIAFGLTTANIVGLWITTVLAAVVAVLG